MAKSGAIGFLSRRIPDRTNVQVGTLGRAALCQNAGATPRFIVRISQIVAPRWTPHGWPIAEADSIGQSPLPNIHGARIILSIWLGGSLTGSQILPSPDLFRPTSPYLQIFVSIRSLSAGSSNVSLVRIETNSDELASEVGSWQTNFALRTPRPFPSITP